MTASITFVVAGLLGHQGGWDEALFVAVPVALFALLLWRANQKAKRLASGAPPAPEGDEAVGDEAAA
jgi:hypothetical protein